MDKRIGYHVEENYYGMKVHQAKAFAQYRATTYSRSVDVEMVNHEGFREIVDTKVPQQQVA